MAARMDTPELSYSQKTNIQIELSFKSVSKNDLEQNNKAFVLKIRRELK